MGALKTSILNPKHPGDKPNFYKTRLCEAFRLVLRAFGVAIGFRLVFYMKGGVRVYKGFTSVL